MKWMSSEGQRGFPRGGGVRTWLWRKEKGKHVAWHRATFLRIPQDNGVLQEVRHYVKGKGDSVFSFVKWKEQ